MHKWRPLVNEETINHAVGVFRIAANRRRGIRAVMKYTLGLLDEDRITAVEARFLLDQGFDHMSAFAQRLGEKLQRLARADTTPMPQGVDPDRCPRCGHPLHDAAQCAGILTADNGAAVKCPCGYE